MKKEFIVRCELNMCAEHEVEIRVTTNMRRKAFDIAKRKLLKEGHFHVKLLDIKEVTPTTQKKGDATYA